MTGFVRRDIVVKTWRVMTAAVLAVIYLMLFGWFSMIQAGERTMIISEVMWDGAEYIELYNNASDEIDINGWTVTRQKLDGDLKTIVDFEDTTVVPAKEYFLIEKSETATDIEADLLVSSLTLLNTGELIKLIDEEGVEIDRANRLGSWYAGENTSHGISMERTEPFDDGGELTSWFSSTELMGGRDGTPKAENSEPNINSAPESDIEVEGDYLINEDIVFSASQSFDEDGDALAYSWSLGDGTSSQDEQVTHSYDVADTYVVALTVSDGELEDESEFRLAIGVPEYSDQIVINEFLVNPKGSDADGEFIELRNKGGVTVNLAGWQLDDEVDGGSSVHVIEDTEIKGNSLMVFERSTTKIALNNSGDSVRLLNPAGELVDEVGYDESVPEGQSYSLADDGLFDLSTKVTKGDANEVVFPDIDEEDDENDDEEDGSEDDDGEVAGIFSEIIPLKDIRNYDAGTEIMTQGVVSVPPGIFGESYLYLAGSGVQVYFSKGDYPELRLGDTVAVTGELSSVRGEARLKLAFAEDISPLTGGDPPEAHLADTGQIGEEMEGSLVTVQGHVSQTSGSTFHIDDGSGETKIYIKPTTGIEKPKMQKGMAVTVTGVVSQTSSGYRVLPRFQEDIRLGLVAGLTTFPATGYAWAILYDFDFTDAINRSEKLVSRRLWYN